MFANYTKDRKRYEAEWKAVAQEFVKHFQEKGWTKTRFQIFMNQKPNTNNTIPWRLDEPRGVEDYRALRYFADLSHRSFGGAGVDPFFFRMDISHFYCDQHKGDPKKDFRINQGNKILEPVDIWVISRHSYQGEMATNEALRLKTSGKEIWEYRTAPRIREPLLEARRLAWSAWLKRQDGFVIWKTFSQELNKGDGGDFIAYLGKGIGYERPLPSLRLKTVRRGLQDLEYMALVSEKKGDDRAVIDRMIRDRMTDDPKDWDKALRELAQMANTN
jgi:hypothetical protein